MLMNTKILIWLVILLLGAGVAGAFWYSSMLSSTTPTAENTNTVQLPTELTPESSITIPKSPSGSATGQSQGATGFTVQDQNGVQVPSRDFIQNGTTIPDAANAGRYLLAGNLGYCTDAQQCQAATSTDYVIYYNSGPQSFTIALTEEPIGQSRLDMEQFMLTTLGMSQQQLCSLNYYVGVTRYVNEQYTGKNLGFSFCPGATPLPK